ncbi:hypothetical protein AtubIFM57258_002851 [Aspergillus tubingensis]|nr:hypothetical protein AtubIFM57258_002851 [Aspergillus tubingensis]
MPRITSQGDSNQGRPDDDDSQSKVALRALSWLTFSKTALTADQLAHAIGAKPGMTDPDRDNLMDPNTIDSLCAGLIAFDRNTAIFRMVKSRSQRLPSPISALALSQQAVASMIQALSRGKSNILFQFLLDKGPLQQFDINSENHYEFSPLLYVTQMRHNNTEFARLLLQRGADPNTTQSPKADTRESMSESDVQSQPELSKEVLDANDLSAQENWDYWVLLAFAAHNGADDLVELLLEYNADPDPINRTASGQYAWLLSMDMRQL